jgi:hypothetical protein
MFWIVRRIMDRLFVKVAVAIASKLESHADLELEETRADFLRRAAQLEKEDVAGMEEVVTRLRSQAAAIGRDGKAPGDGTLEVAKRLASENLREEPSEGAVDGRSVGLLGRDTTSTAGGKKRGRPRKMRADTSPESSSE